MKKWKLLLVYCAFLLALALLAAVLTGKGRQKVPDNTETTYALPSAAYDSPVAATGPSSVAQLFVVESEPVMPGTRVDVIDETEPKRALVVGAIAGNVRWKTAGAFGRPEYPASGFVSMRLTESQWAAIREARNVSIRRSGASTQE